MGKAIKELLSKLKSARADVSSTVDGVFQSHHLTFDTPDCYTREVYPAPISHTFVRTCECHRQISPFRNSRPPHRSQRVVNDFSIQVATVNGSGSQTANLVLLRSILLMGVPVSGKNMFPSNIAGLPDLVHDPGEQARLHRAARRKSTSSSR